MKNIIHVFSGDFGNAASRLEAFAVSGGTYTYGGYPDIDGLFREQAAERDRTKRETILYRLQQLVHERAMFAPIWELAFLQADITEERACRSCTGRCQNGLKAPIAAPRADPLN